MTSVLHDLPRDVPYIATHVWPSQAAIHAGFTKVVNAIPDNWAMALHLSEGALHTVQTPSAYMGYRMLTGFSGSTALNPMAEKDIAFIGHYIDDELVQNIEADCTSRLDRIENGKPLRFLLSIGGAGAQGDYFAGLIQTLLPYIREKKATLYLNIGDYENVWDFFRGKIKGIEDSSLLHFNDWEDTKAFVSSALQDTECEKEESRGIHVFCHKDIFQAVYATNLLMRASDVLMTKPSELAFYPVPKLMIQRVGGHEKWGAIRSAEVGDGTPECPTLSNAQSYIKHFVEKRDLLKMMCRAIMAAKREGVYNGSYHAVELATGLAGVDGKESKYGYAGR